MKEIKHGNKKLTTSSLLIIFKEGDEESGQNRLAFPSNLWYAALGFPRAPSLVGLGLFCLAFIIEQIQEKNHIENAPKPSPSFIEPCIVSDPNLPGASLP